MGAVWFEDFQTPTLRRRILKFNQSMGSIPLRAPRFTPSIHLHVLKMKIPLKNQIAANPMRVTWIITTVALWVTYVLSIYGASGSFSFFAEYPMFFLHLLILLLLAGLGFFAQIPLIPIAFKLTKGINKCDYSAGKRILILAGKHRNRIVTVDRVMLGQGGPSHEVVEEDGIQGEEKYFETYEVGSPDLLKKTISEPIATGQCR